MDLKGKERLAEGMIEFRYEDSKPILKRLFGVAGEE